MLQVPAQRERAAEEEAAEGGESNELSTESRHLDADFSDARTTLDRRSWALCLTQMTMAILKLSHGAWK